MALLPLPPNSSKFLEKSSLISIYSSRNYVGILNLLLWISLLFSTFSTIGAIPSQQKIHNQMNKEELQRIFHVDSHHEVPEYEVVSIRSLVKRSADEEQKRLVAFSAFGQNLKLSLKKNPHIVKQSLRMWIAEPDPSKGIHYEELPQEAEEEIGEAYQDDNNQAALLIHHDKFDGSLLMDGMVGSNLVVKPLPSLFRNKPIHKSPKPHRDDDEGFLDEEGGDEWVVRHGFPLFNDSVPFTTPHSSNSPNSPYGTNSTYGTNGTNGTKGNYGSDGPKRSKTAGLHIVYQTTHIDSHSDYALMEPDSNGGQRGLNLSNYKSNSGKIRERRGAESARSERVRRDAPYVIYPEILVIVDYDGYRLHGGDNLQVKRYFVSFWNGVDLRYKVLKGPKVRISIAGIIISRGRDATPYLERNRVGRDALDSASALTDLGKYLFQERRLPVYDIAVVVTKLDMCRRQFANDVCNRGTAGFAYVGGACVVNKRLEKVNSVAIVEDTGGFSGIIVAAHEVGHLLGCVHDGSPAPSYLGGPGAQKCRWEDGYIMSDLRHTERGFQWSPCSISQFHHFLNGDTATCLYNSPHEDSSLPRVLPGKLLSLDAQCRKDRGTSACFKDDRVCAQLFCFDATSGYCVAYRPAAEGSPCGDGHQHCVSGRCVVEHENIIPDYSHITPSVVRGDAPKSPTTTFSFPTSTYGYGETSTQKQTSRHTHFPTIFLESWSTVTPESNLVTSSPYYSYNKNTTFYTTTPITTTTIQKITTFKTTTPSSPESSTYKQINRFKNYGGDIITYNANSNNKNEEESRCEDRVDKIGGGLTCGQFLSRFGYKYCNSMYIKLNCCLAYRAVCLKL